MYRKYTSKEKLAIVKGYLNGTFSLKVNFLEEKPPYSIVQGILRK